MNELTGHPDWVEDPGASGVFRFRPNPDITIAEDGDTYSLTDGAGNFLVRGTIAELLAYPEVDPDYIAWQEEMERQCGRSISIGAEDGTSCELDNGHDGPHRGRNPYDEGFVEWSGGGMCAGDPLPVRDMRFTS